MARSVNKVILIGHLGKDAETRFTPKGTAIVGFSVATTRKWKDQKADEWKEDTTWTNVVFWNAENLAQYLTKGKQIYVEGRLQARSYEDKEGNKRYVTEVVADEVILLGGGGNNTNSAGQRASSGGRSSAPASGGSYSGQSEGDLGAYGDDEDVPF